MDPNSSRTPTNKASPSSSLFDSVKKRVLELSQVATPSRDLERQFWMPDSHARQCYDCGLIFSILRRRHHCRICGQVFCQACSFYMIDSKLYKTITGNDSNGSVRSCRYCHKTTSKSESTTNINAFCASNSPSSTSASSSSVTSSSLIRNDSDRKFSIESPIGHSQRINRGNFNDFTKNDEAITPTRVRKDSSSWLGFGSNLARRFSSTASLGSFVNPLSTPIQDNKKSRPQSSNSDRFAVLCFEDNRNTIPAIASGNGAFENKIIHNESRSLFATDSSLFHNRRSRHNTGEMQNSSSFDNLYSLMNRKMENKFDENKPKWVKELLEQSKLEEDDLIYDDETESRDEIQNIEIESDIIRESFDDSSFMNTSDNLLDVSKASSENLLEIKLSEEGVVCFRKQSQSPHENRKLKLKRIFGETIDSREFDPEFNDQTEVDYYARETMKQYFFNELATKTPPPSLSICDVSEPEKETLPASDSLSNEELIFKLMSLIYDKHLKCALEQILQEQNLNLDWLLVIHDISSRIANTVTLNHHSYLANVDNYFFGLQNDNVNGSLRNIATEIGLKYYSKMDLRQRIKIKCIGEEAANKHDSMIVQGLVFTKNVSNRKMRTKIDNPKVLLFACSIGYDERKRTLDSGKLTCMDLMRLQEANYGESLCTRIGSLKPDVIFVQGSVSGFIIDRLYEFFNVTVVLNVKRSIMERLAIFTGTQLIISPEIINSSMLGRCYRFWVMDCSISKDMKKSLMVIETDVPSLGCSVLLKGTRRLEEFVKVKNVLLESIYWHYNSRCEQAFNQASNCLPFRNKNPDNNEHWKSLSEIFQYLQKIPQKFSPKIDFDNSINSDDCFVQQASSSSFTPIEDDSDPLRSQKYCSKVGDEQIIDKNSEVNFIITNLSNAISTKFQQILDKIPLSASPNVRFPLPFLAEKDIYFRSCLRPYFALNLMKSQRLSSALDHDVSVGVFGEKSNFEEERGIRKKEGSKSISFEDEDIDYMNYNYLSWMTTEKCSKFPQLKDIILEKAESKLSILIAILKQRYMIQKPHPLLYGEGVPLWKMERFSAPDFRACGPYLRCVPDIVPRNRPKTSENESNDEQKFPEPLSMVEHQGISVLFSVFSPKSKNAPNYCFRPRITDIEYYGKNDMSLGAFLFRHFFFMRTRHGSSAELTTANGTGEIPEGFRKALCPNDNCFESLFRHVMRFAHHRGTLSILMNKVPESQNQQTFSKKVLTWSYCKQCQKQSKIAELSTDALALSFGKFLELKFYSSNALNLAIYDSEPNNCQCELSVRRDAYQFFNFDQLVVSFKYDSIVLYEVAIPPPLISISRKQFASKKTLADSLQNHTLKGHEYFSRLEGELDRIRDCIQNWGQNSLGITASQSSNISEQFNFDSQQDCVFLDEFSTFISEEKLRFVSSLKEIHVRVSEVSAEETSLIEFYRIQNAILKIKRSIIESWTNWNDKITDFLLNRKRIQDKSFNRVLKSILPGSGESKNADNLSILDGPEEAKINDKLSTSNCDLSTDMKTEDSKIQSQRSATISAGTTGKLGAITSRVISKVANKVTAQIDSESKGSVSDIFTPLPHPFECSNNNSPTNGFSQTKRFLLPSNGDVTVVVSDQDLGSIIAYALRTQEYEQKLTKFQEESYSTIDGGLSSKTIEEPLEELSPHIGIDFQDGNSKFYCSIYFAAEFARLRSSLITDGGWSHRETLHNVFAGYSKTQKAKPTGPEMTNKDAEELYIHSLANCIPWKAIGGKSGSTFSKTINQRFILKEISKGELKHFVTFARDYVKYCEDCLQSKRPSTFVKIVGCYELAVSDSIHDILVMENLFYECNISFIYDLKGSMRNRKAEISSNTNNDFKQDIASGDSEVGNDNEKSENFYDEFVQTTTVLMDENLRQISTLYPLYVHVHSKRLLLDALKSDSDFLKSKGVMDYSLLVGFDEQYSEYVVGVIDYVRLYDFTKEIEFRVKKLGKTIDPTIVRPSQYQKRFLEAIQEYFIDVPDKWLLKFA